jgi:large subunit ribosomal protein L30
MAKITVRQIASTIDHPNTQLLTLKSLGLGRVGKKNEIEDSPSIQGMIKKVAHLVEII